MKSDKKKNHHTLAEHYLDIACQNLPTVNRIIRKYGNVSLFTYLKKFVWKAEPSYQQRNDLYEVIQRYATPLLGKSLAQRTVLDLERAPVILTSNHLGVEYFSQSIQSSIIFSLNTITENTSVTTVPVFSFGNIPLNNLTYPRGVLLYNVNQGKSNSMPVKLPIFPDRFKRRIASVVSGFDQKMIRRAEARVNKMAHDEQISRRLADTMHKILQKDYSDRSVLDLPNYSQQAVLLNDRIWKQLFSEADTSPDLIYLEIEKIACMLLEYDLSNPESLAWRVMFDPILSKYILEELDGVKGCWEQKKLALRVGHSDKQSNSFKSCGTVFFWGIDDYGRRIPFFLRTDSLNNEVLQGIDDRGNVRELSYTPETIRYELHENRLIPSLFTCFLTLSFARGLICVGGYFQGEYLPVIQRGVFNALQKTGYDDIAQLVARVPTDGYLSGILAIMSKNGDGLLPAGPTEIIAGRGISKSDVQQMLSLTVREAHIAGLFETVPDVVPRKLRPDDWKKQLAIDCYELLKGRVVVK